MPQILALGILLQKNPPVSTPGPHPRAHNTPHRSQPHAANPRALAFSEGNSEVQVVRPTRPWNMKSGALSCCMCWSTYPKWSRTCCKFSTNLFSSSHYSVSNSHVLVGTGNFIVNSGVNQGNLPRTKVIPFSKRVREMESPISFLGSSRRYSPI